MPHPINRRQKPAWKPAPRPLAPRLRPQDPRKGIRRPGGPPRPAKSN